MLQFRYNRTTGVIIVVGFILAAVIAGIGVVTALTISSSGHTFPSKQCGETPMKIFDDEGMPKYIIIGPWLQSYSSKSNDN